jgi:uncharacterized protein YggE
MNMQATTVAARGLAEAPYTIANFSLSLTAKGKTVPAAKEVLKKQIETLNVAVADMKTKLDIEFVKNSVRTSSSVREDWEYRGNKNHMVGYDVTYNFSFQIDDLDRVNEVFDVLTSLEEVRVANPHFGLKPAQRERLSKKALKNAFAKAYERFETECEVLGLNVADFEIASWEATYHDSQRGERVARAASARAYSNSLESHAMVASAAGGGGGEIDLVSGLAEVNVNLEVGYARKVSQTLKAEVVKKPSLSQENQNHV